MRPRNEPGYAIGYFEGRDQPDARGEGTVEIRIPARPLRPKLAGTLTPPAGPITKTTLLTVTGQGFSSETRVLFNGTALLPLHQTPTEVVVSLDPTKAAKGTKPYPLTLTDGPGRVAPIRHAGSPAQITVKGPDAKPADAVKFASDPIGVNPGTFVKLSWDAAKSKSKLPARNLIEIWVGTKKVDASLVTRLGDKSLGFVAPILPEESGRIQAVIVRMSGKEFTADKPLVYSSEKPKAIASQRTTR
jgi:hypothetical protein